MEMTKIIENAQGQAVQPQKEQVWETFMNGLNSFTDDYFCEERNQGVQAPIEISVIDENPST